MKAWELLSISRRRIDRRKAVSPVCEYQSDLVITQLLLSIPLFSALGSNPFLKVVIYAHIGLNTFRS